MVFRPISSEVYDDVILFKVLDGPNAGGFNVPVRALLPTLQVQDSNALRKYQTEEIRASFALGRHSETKEETFSHNVFETCSLFMTTGGRQSLVVHEYMMLREM